MIMKKLKNYIIFSSCLQSPADRKQKFNTQIFRLDHKSFTEPRGGAGIWQMVDFALRLCEYEGVKQNVLMGAGGVLPLAAGQIHQKGGA